MKEFALARLAVKKKELNEATVAESAARDQFKPMLSIARTEEQKGGCKYEVRFSVEQVQNLAPDEEYRFAANIRHYYVSSDKLILTTTDSGLLNSTVSTSVDNTAEIIEQIVKAVASLGGGPLPIAGEARTKIMQRAGQLKENGQRCCTEEPLVIEETIDLSNARQLGLINDRLRPICMSLQLCGLSEDSACSSPRTPDQYKASGENGLYYRRDLPYLLNLVDGKNFIQANTLVMMPNLSPISRVPFDAGLFVTSKQKVTFNNGMLTSYDTDKPSEIPGLVSIPADIGKP